MKKLMFVVMCAVLLSGCITQSEGERVGTISKLTQKGVFISTWEGEAILGGAGASGNKDNTWHFTVEDDAVIEKMKTFNKSGKLVVLKYRQEMFTGFFRGDTHYFIQDVQFATN